MFLSWTLHIYTHTILLINLPALWHFTAVQSISTQSLTLPIFQTPSASFHIFSESKQSISGSLDSCSYTFPPLCNSFTHLTSHSYCYLVLKHQFSHQITKAWGIKIYNKPQGTVISVTAISVSTEMQTYAQTYFKSLTSKSELEVGNLICHHCYWKKNLYDRVEVDGERRKKVERRKKWCLVL